MEWVGKGVDFYKAAGRNIALAEFTNPEGRFVDADMSSRLQVCFDYRHEAVDLVAFRALALLVQLVTQARQGLVKTPRISMCLRSLIEKWLRSPPLIPKPQPL